MIRALTLALVLLSAAEARAERRFAVIVGSNEGGASDLPLRFAERDAEQVALVLRELGSVDGRDLHLVLDGDADAVRRALAQVDEALAGSNEPGMLFFYYSGHADLDALHLGRSRLPWAELKERVQASRARLKVAFADACHSGRVTAARGFALGPSPTVVTPAQGTAFLVASESVEVAQESSALGGGFFSHYLVSGLRGAADVNGDGRVTLAELQAYATAATLEATGAWAPSIQHPVYLFDISGHGEVVLTDLRNPEVRLELGPELEGRLLVSERDNSLVVAELDKREGVPGLLALPRGRYLVHLRRPRDVSVAELTLPWGGTARLGLGSFSRRSYQEVAQRGANLELRRQRLELALGLESEPLRGMGAAPGLRVRYVQAFGLVELGAAAIGSLKRFQGGDTGVDTRVLGGRLFAGLGLPTPAVDFSVSCFAELEGWWQEVALVGERSSWLPATGLEAAARLPIYDRWFVTASVEGKVLFPEVVGAGAITRATFGGTAGVGAVF